MAASVAINLAVTRLTLAGIWAPEFCASSARTGGYKLPTTSMPSILLVRPRSSRRSKADFASCFDRKRLTARPYCNEAVTVRYELLGLIYKVLHLATSLLALAVRAAHFI